MLSVSPPARGCIDPPPPPSVSTVAEFTKSVAEIVDGASALAPLVSSVEEFDKAGLAVLELRPCQLSRFFLVRSRWQLRGPLPAWPSFQCACAAKDQLCFNFCAVCTGLKFRHASGCSRVFARSEPLLVRSKCATCQAFDAHAPECMKRPCLCANTNQYLVCSECLGVQRELPEVRLSHYWVSWPSQVSERPASLVFPVSVPVPAPARLVPGPSGQIMHPQRAMSAYLRFGRSFVQCDSKYGPALRPS